MSTITSEIRLRVRAEGEKVLVDLGAKLNSLANQATLSSNNFKGLAEELKKLQQTTVQSTRNIKDYSASWRELASSVDISSKEFRQATAEADALDARLKGFQGVQTTVASNFRNIATAATQASAAMQTANGLIRDPLTGAYRKAPPNVQFGPGEPPAAPTGRYAQQEREASAQGKRDARRREIMQQRAAYAGDTLGTRDPRTGAIIAGGMGPFQNVGTNFPRPLGPELPPPPRRRFAGAAQTVGAVAAAGIFGGPEGLVGAGIGSLGGPVGAAVGGAIGAQVGMLRQAVSETATYASEITKLNIALKGITKTSQEYSDAQNAINSISKSLNVPIAEATSGFTKLSASVIGAGGNVNDAEIVFRGITTAIKGTGGGAAEVQGALLAMSQVFSKGKVTAEELSGQLGERLPGAVTAFAKATGRTLPQLQKDLENGVVGLNDVIKFAIALETQHSETAKKVASSSEESGARMTVALDEVKLAVGQAFQPIGSSFQESITEAAKTSIVAVKMITNELKFYNKEIEKAFGKENVASIAEGIKFLFTTMVDEASKVLNPMHQIASLLRQIYDTTGQGKLANAGVAAISEPDAMGNVYDMASGKFLRNVKPGGAKPPTKFEEPKGKDDGAGAKKRANDAAEARMQEDVNKMQESVDKQKIKLLERIKNDQLKINILIADENDQNKQATLFATNELKLGIAKNQNIIKSQELEFNSYKDRLRINLEDNAQLRNAKLRANQQARITGLSQLKIELETEDDAILTGQTAELKKQTNEKQKFLKELDKEIKLYAQSGNQAKEEMEIRLRMRGAKPRELEAALEDAAIRRKTKELRDQKQQEFTDQGFTGDDITSKINDLDAAGIKLLETAEATRRLKQQMEDLNATDFTQGIRNGVTTYLESIGTLSENVKEVTGSALQGLGDQLGNFVTTGKASFTDLANSIIKDMIRITTQQLIMKPLLGALGSLFPGGGGGGGGGGGLPGFGMDPIIPGLGLGKTPGFKFANGGIMTEMGPMMMKKYARGGIATGPQMALYGEGSQNEAYVPLPDGRRIPVAMQGGGGGGTSVVVNVDAKGSNVEGDTPKGQQLGRALSQAVQQELLKQKRPGGLLS